MKFSASPFTFTSFGNQKETRMNKKKTAIILVNWNSFDYTHECIESLHQIQDADFDIIIVDNGSQDHSGTRLKEQHPDILLIESDSNLGFTGGNNLGLQYSLEQDYQYSLLLNNDTVVEPDFLGVLTTYMDAHPRAGAIQPKIFYYHNRSVLWDGGSYFNALLGIAYTSGHGKKPSEKHTILKKVDWVTGCAFFTRNSILKETGLLASNFFIYYEDVDLSFRIKKLGYELIYHPGSVIYHIAGVSNKKTTKDKEGFVNPIVHYLNTRNRIWLLKEHTPIIFVPTVTIYTFFYTVAVMLYFTARLRFKKLAAVSRAIKDGLTGTVKYN